MVTYYKYIGIYTLAYVNATAYILKEEITDSINLLIWTSGHVNGLKQFELPCLFHYVSRMAQTALTFIYLFIFALCIWNLKPIGLMTINLNS